MDIAYFVIGIIIGALMIFTYYNFKLQTIKYKNMRKSTGKFDISGQEVFEGDIIESHLGGQILEKELIVKYGIYQAYCPCDECYMDSVEFYVSSDGLPDMPIGALEDYAKVVGNVFDKKERKTK